MYKVEDIGRWEGDVWEDMYCWGRKSILVGQNAGVAIFRIF